MLYLIDFQLYKKELIDSLMNTTCILLKLIRVNKYKLRKGILYMCLEYEKLDK